MQGDLTQRIYRAAHAAGPGATREEVAQAVCLELSAWCEEEAALYGAKLTSSRRGIRAPSPGDRAHREVIEQLADHLARVGDAAAPA
ncbi:hypothetical protein OHA37_27150 [Streptomyces sp. NBC_00335]|uniref:hypothetical protein n=1 Tax=unclassified Streptomyces TaxID=2593676 RepID=UPI0022503796|nr:MULTISPECIES: hypothetical protein [unclassified Streptomyces]MCX5407529.1 hypothetical protein [Streptomyces sp. NBC_00086]